MRRQAGSALIVLCFALAMAAPAAADVVTDWNGIALPIVASGHPGTPATVIDMAIVHAAMHDAAQAYDKRFRPYAAEITGATGSQVVAVAKAAREALAAMFPSQAGAIGTTYNNYLAALLPAPSADDIAGGEWAGGQAAEHVLTLRMHDGRFPATFPPFPTPPVSTAPGQWQPNSGSTSMVSPWAKNVTPFTLDSLGRCAAPPPPALTSAEYAEAYNEVKAFGSATGSSRDDAQTLIAKTYSGNFLNQYNRLFTDLSNAYLGTDVPGVGDRARLFALTNMAMADAFICSWSAKQQYNFWRPAQAIRRGNEDGNALTDPDTNWTTYFSRNFSAAQSPNYPDYTSGANNLTGAMTRMLALFFDTDKPKDSFNVYATAPAVPLVSGEADHLVYTRFSDVAKDVIDARIYLGIHFRFADTEARSQGRRVANHAFKNVLEPLDKHGNK